VKISFEQQEIAHIRTFDDYFGQNQYFGYTCPCQIPAYEIICDPEALSFFTRNVIFKGSNPHLIILMDM